MKQQLLRPLLALLLVPSLTLAQPIDQTANSVDSQFATPTNLTDDQMTKARDFVHRGIRDRVYNEKCAAVNDCKDDDGLPLEEMIGKAYAMVGMMAGGLVRSPETPAATAGVQPGATGDAAQRVDPAQARPAGTAQTGGPAGNANQRPEEQRDYCIMVAAGYEAVAGIMQASMQRRADNSINQQGDEQIKALLRLRETHRTREKTSKYQSLVYAGVTACYVGLASTGTAMNTAMILKMSGAGALTLLYMRKANKHKTAAKKIGEVIDSMEWAGKNCNPWTKTACFCAEATSKTLYPTEFQEVCVLNNGNPETPRIALGCAATVDNKVSYDKECKCRQNNSCLRANLNAYNPRFGVGANLMNEANRTFDTLSTGDIDQGQIDRASLRQAAIASRIAAKYGAKLPTPALQTEQQRAVAKAMGEFLPANIAGIAAAARPVNGSGVRETGIGAAAISKIPPKVRERLAEAISVGYQNGGGASAPAAEDPGFVMPALPGMEESPQGGTEVVNFAEAATSKAEVSNLPTTPIFEIISNRYRRSAWSRLDTQGN
jgi:hypothetical protein